jgi:5-methyltetrahydropteroyltriglutamate--homocysteine methyltransferase
MCGALSEKGDPARELDFAEDLLRRVVAGAPRERTALHVCRGNWTRDESALLAGDYRPLADLLSRAPVGTLFLEFSTPRAGEVEALADLPRDVRIGVGLVNPKLERIETVEEILARAERALRVFGPARLLLVPDCGFATFADNPVASSAVAEAKLRSLAEARDLLRGRSAATG